MSWGPKNKSGRRPAPSTGGPSPGAITEALSALPISDIEEREQLLPPDPKTVAELKASISVGGDVVPPITVRKRADGRFELLDGQSRLSALKEMGITTVSAIVLSGLSDWDAKFRRNAGQRGRIRTALDRALIENDLLELMKERVSQDATPVGGRQPEEKYIRKVAKELKLPKDRLARSRKIASIGAEVQRRLREQKLADNQKLLLKIAGAGETEKLQMEALELHRPKNGTGPKARQHEAGSSSGSAASNEFCDTSGGTESVDGLRSRKQMEKGDRDLSAKSDDEDSSTARNVTNDKETKVLVWMKMSDRDEIERQPAGTQYTLSAICMRQKEGLLKVTKIERITGEAGIPGATDDDWGD